ncbi:MAG: laminin G domain-containing protein, partial [Chloroflexi bacterium]|nr:laminin G domain-containing protein [Chloroflexota bacterium]
MNRKLKYLSGQMGPGQRAMVGIAFALAISGTGLFQLIVPTELEAAIVECVPLPSGLVGWWSGDGSPNDIADGNDGVLRNGATFAPGMVGQAFRLDGVDDYVEVSDSPSLRLSDGSFSIDAWIFPTQPGGGQFDVIVDKSLDNSNLDYELLLHTDGRLRLDTRSLANSILSPSAIPANRWTHVVGVQDVVQNEVRLYVDGTLVATAPLVGSPVTNLASLLIGIRHSSGGTIVKHAFKGLIDEVEILDRAITDVEIKAIFDAGSAGKCRVCTAPPPGLLGWWPGDGSPNDILGGNDGVLRNGATFAPGMVGQAFRLDGVDDYVEVPDSPSLRLSEGSFTIDAWIRPVTSGGGQFDVIVDKSLDNSNLDYQLTLHTDGRLRLVTRNLANDILSPSPIPN